MVAVLEVLDVVVLEDGVAAQVASVTEPVLLVEAFVAVAVVVALVVEESWFEVAVVLCWKHAVRITIAATLERPAARPERLAM